MRSNDTYWEKFWQRHVTRRRVLQGAALGGAGLAAAAVIGCEEEDGSGTPATQQPGGASDQPRQGGTTTWVSQSPETAETQDVHKIGHTTMWRTGMVYNKLLRGDMSKYPDQIDYIGELAESFEIVDATTWVFNLHQGAKFTNIAPVNGRAVTAHDVVYSYQRQIAEGVNASVFRAINTMEAVDDHTLRINLKNPDADFVWSIADQRSMVIPREMVEAAGGDLTNGPSIGSGPWILGNWVHNQILEHRRNPDYFLSPLPYADVLQVITVPDQNTAQAAFRTGQVLNIQANKQVEQIMRSSVPDLQTQTSELIGATAGDRLWFNPTKAPVNDERVRQALGMLFDRKAIIDQVVFGDGWVTAGIFMPAFDWHLTEADLNEYLAFDPQRARQLFQAAGFDPRSWKPVLDAGIPGGTGTVEDAEFYLSALRDVGIEAQINIVDKTEIVEHVWQQARTDFCVCNKPTFNGTNGEIFAFYHSGGIFAEPYRLLADTEFDRMIQQQAGELDPEARKAILLDVQRRVLKTAVAVPVFSRTNPIALQPHVRGYKQWSDPTGGDGHRLTEVWLADA